MHRYSEYQFADDFPILAKDVLLRTTLVLTFVSAFLGGPVVPVGPVNFRLFDLSFVLLVASLVLYQKEYFRLYLPANLVLLFSFLLYLGLVVFLPIVGFALYDYPVGYIVGEFRWIQATVFGVAVVVYAQCSSIRLYDQLLFASKILVVIHTLFLTFQALHFQGIHLNLSIIEFWYASQGGLEESYHIGRFSGAGSSIAMLGWTACIGVLVFGYSYWKDGQNLPYLIASCFLMFASSSRTSLVAVLGIGISLVLSQRVILRFDLKKVSFGAVLLSLVALVVFHFNIGRMRTQFSRYVQIVEFVLGKADWGEVSGRSTTWTNSLDIVSSEYFLGTLANPAWVLRGTPGIATIDSYYLLVYLQGGWILLIAYLSLLLCLSVYTLRLTLNDSKGVLPLGLVIVIAVHSLTQNFMTGISGKILLMLTVASYVVIATNRPRSDRA